MNKKDNNSELYAQIDEFLDEFCKPGIFCLTCIPKQKAYFGESFTPWWEVVELLNACQLGQCPNEELGFQKLTSF